MKDTAKSGLRLIIVDESIALGGVERVWLHLVPELAALCEKVVWVLPDHKIAPLQRALPPGTPVEFECFHWPTWSPAKLRSAVERRMARLLEGKYPEKVARRLDAHMSERLRALARQHGATHFIYPALFTQAFPEVDHPVWGVVHDVNYDPSWREDCLVNLGRWGKMAEGLITVSDFTRRELLKLYPEFEGKLYAVSNATDWTELPSGGTAVRARKGDTETLLYYPANFRPHKGHALLLSALRRLHGQGLEFKLVLTGDRTQDILSPQPLAVPALEAARQVLESGPEEFRRRIQARGIIPAREVEAYYAAASLVVLPTAYEGYGLPLMEAVGRGKRVLCSDIAAFREQIQTYRLDRGVAFARDNTPETWAEGIEQALKKPGPQPYSVEELRAGFDRWTWRKAAQGYVQALNKALVSFGFPHIAERTPRFSVLLNNYNYAHYLCPAIRSVLAQSFGDFELIIVDDGSTDQSRQLIAQEKDGRILRVLKENGGQGSAFKAGLARASAPYVAFLDADDMWEPHKLERCDEVLRERQDVVLLNHSFMAVNATGEVVGGPHVFQKCGYYDVLTDIRRYDSVLSFVPTSFLVGRRRECLQVPIDEEAWRIAADTPLVIGLALRGKVFNLNETLGYYRTHGANRWLSHVNNDFLLRHFGRVYALVNEEMARLGRRERFDFSKSEFALNRRVLETSRYSAKGVYHRVRKHLVLWSRSTHTK